ncbi:MAG: hypothetical protein FD176_2722 [Rhodospirillaceae bacterium]|nr:MAG: hypothetical protein FD176_2722 [Rhodospirillaceae bacterium]TNC98233.1 MAG: hypothetical protein FD119_375 [Stygiobacter sp.]
MVDLRELSCRLNVSQGGNADLDRLVADFFAQPCLDYSESTEQCRALVRRVLPDWRLHLGFGVSGVLPYAALSLGDRHYEAEAATVPLAILRSLMQAVSPPEAPGQTEPPPA